MLRKIMNNIKRWGNKMFNRKSIVEQIVQSEIKMPNYSRLETWKAIYSGEFKGFKQVGEFTLASGKKNRDRHQINMAKVVANELAKLAFTDNVEINVDDEELSDVAESILDENRFYKEFKDRVEVMLALGGYVIKANPEQRYDGSYKINMLFVNPENFIPIDWSNGQVTEGAFLNVTVKGKKTYVLVESHRFDTVESEDKVTEQGEPLKERVIRITNELFEIPDALRGTNSANLLSQQLTPVPLETLYDGLEAEVFIHNMDTPLFRYMKAPGVNNFDIDSPFGISVFANAQDTLLALNVAFDSFIREFQLGKRRIIIPAEAAQTFIDPITGVATRYFDADDEAYVAFKFSDPEKQKITDNTVEIRVDEHLKALNGMLDVLAMQCGLSAGTFTFDGTALKTATEVISENSKTYQTVKDITNILDENLTGFIHMMLKLAWMYEVTEIEVKDDLDISIMWDDSIIGDKYTDTDYYIKLNVNGLMSKREIMRRQLKMTDEQIDEMFAELASERSLTPEIDELFVTDQQPIIQPPTPPIVE